MTSYTSAVRRMSAVLAFSDGGMLLLGRFVVNPVLEHGVGDREENGTNEDSNEPEREQPADDADKNQQQRQG